MKIDLWQVSYRQLVERQLNHNMTFQVPVQSYANEQNVNNDVSMNPHIYLKLLKHGCPR